MIEFIWEVVVKEEAQGRFELAYGPGGAWSELCGRSPGFRGTTLLRDVQNPRRYLSIELWDTQDLREQMLVERQTEYTSLEASFGEWAESRTELGAFRLLAEATVHPHGRARRTRTDESRRRGRKPAR